MTMSFAHPMHSYQTHHQSHLAPSYPPISNQNFVNFDGTFPSATVAGQTSFDGDSECDSNFTSDEFDSEEGIDDIDQAPIIPPCVPTPVIVPEPDIADQLLHFAEMVNKDIQKYFGKRKAIDDMDDAVFYKDRFASGKSGRELYYADLLKVAQQGETMDAIPESKLKHRQERIIISSNDHMDKKLGPLGELFDFALSSANRQHTMGAHWIGGNNKVVTDERSAIIPWRKRTLPTSFFLEPRTDRRTHGGLTQDAPDFSDLMAAAADD